ncbi:putative RNA methyltransferase [Brachybacterium sp. AOP43-C2-M15]|uniref:putative RNA methyltransferase n=1 Tax=Brachybacterium sp. AOP43-C2-M15 TaxID=3457661 RepID=UPI0040340A09
MAPPVPASLQPWLEALVCPHCGEALTLTERTLRCPQRHSFDLARAGYLPLLAGAPATSGDDDEMARARDRFLGTGAYSPLREAIADLAPTGVRRVLDIGCGTGYYLAGALDRLPAAHGLGVDTSVRALRFAARCHDRAAAASWDVFSPFPLRDGSVDLVLDVFAPRNPAEFARVLAPGGHLMVVRPAPDHLLQLRRDVPGMVRPDPRKEERLHEVLDPLFTAEESRELHFDLDLAPGSARDLIAMTPSARHVEPAVLARLGGSGPRITVSVVASLHRRR